MSELEKDYLASLDRRISEHDEKIADAARDHTELTHEIKQLLERINNGVSPSVNKVREVNEEIKGEIRDLAHKFELDRREMKDMVKESTEHTRLMVENFDKHRLAPIERDMGFMKKTFLYGLVGALIVFVGQKAISVVWEKVFDQRVAATVHQ